jgi:hypothetical protein
MPKRSYYGEIIAVNAKIIRELHDRIHTTLRDRDTSYGRKIWSDACAEFHAKYDNLAFPGGYDRGLKLLAAGDLEMIEAALVFLEMRPYFFRSQYMCTKLLRLIKRAPLDALQAERLQTILATIHKKTTR